MVWGTVLETNNYKGSKKPNSVSLRRRRVSSSTLQPVQLLAAYTTYKARRLTTTSMIVADIVIILPVGEKWVLDFPDGRLGANRELEILALETIVLIMLQSDGLKQWLTVILSQYL